MNHSGRLQVLPRVVPPIVAVPARERSRDRTRRIERAIWVATRLSSVFLPVWVMLGFAAGGIACYTGFLIVFVFFHLMELGLFLAGCGTRITEVEQSTASTPRLTDAQEHLALGTYAALHLVAVVLLLGFADMGSLTTFELVGTVLSLGAMTGSVGALASHEFIHRKTPGERALGIALLSSFSYPHFYISHLFGHHRSVGTHGDWSTSRHGETSYAFLLRAVGMGLLGGWRIERDRRSRGGRHARGIHRFWFLIGMMCTIWAMIYWFRGGLVLAVFLGSSAVAVTLAEMVNYLSHYGLTRKAMPGGRLEPASALHTWESNDKITNWFIFNAGMHVEHHRAPGTSQEALSLAFDKPCLPYGLPMMTILAFIPPLYFRVMDARLAEMEAKKG